MESASRTSQTLVSLDLCWVTATDFDPERATVRADSRLICHNRIDSICKELAFRGVLVHFMRGVSLNHPSLSR
jgi:hypothetical protein